MASIAPEPIADRVRALLEPILARDGYELVEAEWLREGPAWVLRLYIDKPAGVGIDDCQGVSRLVEDVLDVEDFIEPSYSLEVSSPGVDRPLRKPQDFERFKGQRVHLRTYAPLTNTGASERALPRKNWSGTLRGFADGCVAVEVDGELHRVPIDKVAKAHLEYDFDADLKSARQSKE